MSRAGLVAGSLVAGCLAAGCTDEERFQYEWDDRRVLCSSSLDDLTGAPDWDRIEERLAYARDHGSVAGLDFIRFGELSPASPPRAGLALCFDDQSIAEWYGIRDRLAAHGAKVTFFVTRLAERSAEELGRLAELAAGGHGVESHSVNHLDAPAYAREHGLDAYIADELLPSLQTFRTAGYPSTSFAFPFGASTRELEAAVLEHVDRVRVGAGSCPW